MRNDEAADPGRGVPSRHEAAAALYTDLCAAGVTLRRSRTARGTLMLRLDGNEDYQCARYREIGQYFSELLALLGEPPPAPQQLALLES